MGRKTKENHDKATVGLSAEYPPPRQLMVMGGRLVTVDGKEPHIPFPDGTEVNVVKRSGFTRVLSDANMMRFWGS